MFTRLIRSWYLLRPEEVEALFHRLKEDDPKRDAIAQTILDTDLELAQNPKLRQEFQAEVRQAREERESRLGGILGRLVRVILPVSPKLFSRLVFWGSKEDAIASVREFDI